MMLLLITETGFLINNKYKYRISDEKITIVGENI